jgi:hypothetical protein
MREQRAATVALLAMTAVAHADPPPEAVDVDRLASPPGRPELGFDGGAPVGEWAASVQAGYLDRPLTLSAAGATLVPVEHRETLVVGGASELGNSVVFDAALPVSHQIGTRFTGLGDDRALGREVLGDLRFGARLRVNGHVFARVDVTAPTGDEFEFAGAPGYTVAWTLIGRATLPADIVLAANAGIRLRGTEVTIADSVVGNELFGAAGIVVPLPPIRPLWCARDQVALTAEIAGVLGDEVHGKAGPSPVEARLGLVTHPRGGFQVGVRVGAGLDDELGAPRFRATVELAWHAGPLVKPPEPIREEPPDDEIE